MTTRETPSAPWSRRLVSYKQEQTGMDKENAACNFRDERLKKHFWLLLEQFWTNMGQTIPFACQD